MAANSSPIPLEMIKGNAYGRYAKISIEEKFNLIVSDNFLVPHAGHAKVGTFDVGQNGRSLYVSAKANIMLAVVGGGVYLVDNNLSINKIGSMNTLLGDVFIAENDGGQIAICDRLNLYIYDYNASTFAQVTMDFTPGHIEFQDGYFIAPEKNTNKWRLSALNNGLSWGPSSVPPTQLNEGLFQTKANNVVATIRFPGAGNQLLVVGQIVTEAWTDVGAQLFPYQKNTSYNIDYGCTNASTIASNDKFVVWLGINDKSGAVIMYCTGGDINQISNDGINFRLARLTDPSNSFGFSYKQDGHLFYQITFLDPDDNFTLLYDFNTQMFFSLTDEYGSAHIAKKVVFFNDDYYFVSFKNGNLYKISSEFTTYDGIEIPRTIMTKPIRLPDESMFIGDELSFLIEQGDSADLPRIDITLSSDGGISFGNSDQIQLNAYNNRRNRITYRNLGMSNDLVIQLRLWGLGKFVLSDATLTVHQ